MTTEQTQELMTEAEATALAEKIETFMQGLTPQEQAFLQELVQQALPDDDTGGFMVNLLIRFALMNAGYAASFAGGVAGWVAGGGSLSNAPYGEIHQEADRWRPGRIGNAY